MPVQDKKKQAEYARRHYAANKIEIKSRAIKFSKIARKRNLVFSRRVKRFIGCNNCGMKNPLCLDFHHLSDKSTNVADGVKHAWSLNKLKEEMRKCIILCANCHRIKTLS